VANRVVVLDQGELIEQGPPEQIFTAPEHPRTRAFLRRMFKPLEAHGSLQPT
jgi:polar amino acid transport system ATP-binding protein